MNDQTPLKREEPASEGLARKFGDWCREAALGHKGGGQEIHDFMAHTGSIGELHRLVNRMAAEQQLTLPLRERRPQFSIILGGYAEKEVLVAEVESKGHKITVWAKAVIENEDFVVLGTQERYDFFPATVKELTGKNQVTTTELYATRDRLGYCDAPDESALAIRMEYTDQPMDERRAVLSKPRADADGYLYVLRLERDADGSFVDRYCAYPDHVWYGRGRLFVCRKYQPLAA